MSEGRRGKGGKSQGLSVTARLAIVISGAIAVFMIVFGIVIYNVVSSILSRQIDETGIQAVRCMALPAVETWRPFAGTSFQGREAEFPKQVPVPAEEQDSFNDIRARNIKRISRLFDSSPGDMLDAVILTANQRQVIAGRGAVEWLPSRNEVVRGVTIEHGVYTIENRRHRARAYKAPIEAFDGSHSGWAVLTLSEERIQEKLGQTLLYIAFLALLFLGLGTITSFFLGRRFTTPIIQLTDDVQAVADGDLDHRTRPHSRDEIGALALTFDQMTRNLKEARDAERDHIHQRHQLNVALEIGENLIPKDLPKIEGFELEACHHMGQDGGGDFYDVVPMAEDRWGILIASSSGQGIPATMLTTMVRSFLIAVSDMHIDVASLLKHINRLLSPDLRRGLYATAALARLDVAARRLTLANAGHAPLVCFRAATQKVELVHSEGIALGFDKGPIFDKTLQEVAFDLEPGDRVVFCAPGLFQLENEQGEALGEKRFYGLLAKTAAKGADSRTFLDTIVRTLRKFQGEREGEGTINMVTLRRIG